MSGELLRLERITKHFGGLTALNGISFSVSSGTIKGLIGPNGAGKTTAFNVISGIYEPSGGAIYLDGMRVDRLPSYQLARLGMARTFQTVKLFPTLSVLENVMAGCHAATHGGILRCAIPYGRIKKDERIARNIARDCLTRVGLLYRAEQSAGELPFGLQRMLEIARALATKPRLLLLDEPAAGLSAEERSGLRRMILELKRDGLTILLIEHDMSLVMGIADTVAVLEFGSMLAEGPPESVQADPEVIKAYLGA